MSAQFVVDATQYSSYQLCPLKWYEQYVRGVQVVYPKGQRDDALALGILTHDGYANWYRDGKPVISQALIEEIGPTPEALNLCKAIIQEHARVYCNDTFAVEAVEEQIIIPVERMRIGVQDVEIALSAKLDLIGRAQQAMAINAGGVDVPVNITAGVFSHEDKTKSAAINRAMWIKRWQVNKQAVFQILALTHRYGAEALASPQVVLNVAEKPQIYTPVRKCKIEGGCARKIRVSDWITDTGGLYRCPNCGVAQSIDMPEPSDTTPTPTLFRTCVTLTPEQIDMGKQQIIEVAREMAEVKYGSRSPRMHENECVEPLGRWSCDYFDAHSQWNLAEPGENLQLVEDPLAYMHTDVVGE